MHVCMYVCMCVCLSLSLHRHLREFKYTCLCILLLCLYTLNFAPSKHAHEYVHMSIHVEYTVCTIGNKDYYSYICVFFMVFLEWGTPKPLVYPFKIAIFG